MKRSDFHFELPPELIAQHPLAERSASRLLCLDGNSGAVVHRRFTDLVNLLQPGDLLVFNNTRVIPARLWGRKETGGQVEILVERVIGSHRALAHVRASKSPRVGSRLLLSAGPGGEPGSHELQVIGREDALFLLSSEGGAPLGEIMTAIGHMPLPPYIERADEQADRERYQTVYAARDGAVAAPTAGLHFTEALLAELADKGVQSTTVTLHVGAGTFQPVRADDIEDHHMHAEYIEVTAATCDAVAATRAGGGRVVAVGTTAVRSLESASAAGTLQPGMPTVLLTLNVPNYIYTCLSINNFIRVYSSTLYMEKYV